VLAAMIAAPLTSAAATGSNEAAAPTCPPLACTAPPAPIVIETVSHG
jgi:hypothetical protein